jgi:hypothetical protein
VSAKLLKRKTLINREAQSSESTKPVNQTSQSKCRTNQPHQGGNNHEQAEPFHREDVQLRGAQVEAGRSYRLRRSRGAGNSVGVRFDQVLDLKRYHCAGLVERYDGNRSGG